MRPECKGNICSSVSIYLEEDEMKSDEEQRFYDGRNESNHNGNSSHPGTGKPNHSQRTAPHAGIA